MLGTALALAQRSLHVFPIKPRSKEPACEHGCKDATIDVNVIRQWWRSEPSYNIAIATGSISNIFVSDVDGGESTLRKLEAENGELPKTVEALTGNNGRHLYFKMPNHPVRNSAGRLGPHLDIRGDGGYVVAPPSIHPSGRRYEWSVDSANAFADAPQWLLNRINGHAKHKQITPPIGVARAGVSWR
jgi:Bifunctional DNA primase/polymerase, N-terminal